MHSNRVTNKLTNYYCTYHNITFLELWTLVALFSAMFARWQDSVSFCVGFILLQTMAVDAVDKKGVRIFWPDLTKTEKRK